MLFSLLSNGLMIVIVCKDAILLFCHGYVLFICFYNFELEHLYFGVLIWSMQCNVIHFLGLNCE